MSRTLVRRLRFRRPDGRIYQRLPIRAGLVMTAGEPMAWDGKHLQKVIPGKFENVVGTFGTRDPTFPDYAWIFQGMEGD